MMACGKEIVAVADKMMSVVQDLNLLYVIMWFMLSFLTSILKTY